MPEPLHQTVFLRGAGRTHLLALGVFLRVVLSVQAACCSCVSAKRANHRREALSSRLSCFSSSCFSLPTCLPGDKTCT